VDHTLAHLLLQSVQLSEHTGDLAVEVGQSGRHTGVGGGWGTWVACCIVSSC
jgi:hypothetical protein